jgi:hypothetical protein
LGPRDLGCQFGATLALSFLLFHGSCMLLDIFVTFIQFILSINHMIIYLTLAFILLRSCFRK